MSDGKKKPPKMKKYAVTYRNTRIMVPYPRNPRKGICVACGRRRGDGIKVTQLHHTIYEFITKTVKKNPLLALKNTLELCFPCHQICDNFRGLLDRTSYERILMVFKVLPHQQQMKMLNVCDMLLDYYEETKPLNRKK